MAKGSTASNLVPLVICILVLGAVAAIGFVGYSIAHDVGHQTRKKLEKKNVSFTKDGMKVGVKEKSQEQQGDSAQKYLHINSICGRITDDDTARLSRSGTTLHSPITSPS
jgi:hypothetical protein